MTPLRGVIQLSTVEPVRLRAANPTPLIRLQRVATHSSETPQYAMHKPTRAGTLDGFELLLRALHSLLAKPMSWRTLACSHGIDQSFPRYFAVTNPCES